MPEQEGLRRQQQLHQQHQGQGRATSPFHSTILNTNTPEHQSQLLEWSRQFLQAETTADLPTLFQFISKQTNNNDNDKLHNNNTQIIAPDSKNSSSMGGEDGDLDLAEALALTPFATLKKGGDDSADGAAARPDRLGRTIMCSPQIPLASTQQRAPLGIIFRVGDVVEAIQLSAPKISGGGEEEEEANVEGGDMKIIGTLPLDNTHQVAKIACSDDARLLLVGYSNGTITCLDVLFAGNESELAAQFQLRWTLSTGFEDATIQFPTLEFLHGSDLRHHFLAVVESTIDQNARTVWMDAASSASAPPSINLWPIGGTDGTVTCATPCPSEGDTIAFGTNTGKLGIYCGGNTQYLDHPLLDYEEEDGPWKITHLNWFNPTSLAVGLTRVIIDPDAEDDDEEEDDLNQHEANLFMGTLEQDTWSFTELGDVVPFFSVPKGGRHVFHTAILPTATSCMMLAGCNVGSDIALLCKQNDEWNIVELMEGSQMACPTDEDDEFLYPLGLSVVMSTTASSGQQHPFAMLASTDGSVMGFAPQHQTRGEGFFSCQLSNIGVTEGMAVPVAVSEAPSAMGEVSEVMPSPEVAAAVLAEDGCILSGLDLGLDTVDTENNAAPPRPSLDALFDGNDNDDDETNDSASSLDSLDSDDWGQGETPPKDETTAQTASGLMSGMAAPSFSFGGGTFNPPSSPTKPAFGFGGTSSGFSFGGAGGTANTFGSAFGVTSTTFGAAASPPSTPKTDTQSAAPMFGSSAPIFGSSAPVFGSTAASSQAVGFGALASASAGIKTNGFGTGINLDDIKKEGESQKEAAPQKEAPKESPAPAPAAPVFGLGSSPAFGSSASTSTGFGALAASASSSGQGFGVKAEDKKDEEKNKKAEKPPRSSAAFPPMSATAPKNPFSAKPTSSAAFPPMSAAAPKPFGSSTQEEKPKETPSAAPAPVFGSGSAPVFGSGTKPTFGFNSTGFAASFSPSGSATSGTTKTSPFGTFGSSTPFGSSSMAPSMAKPLFGDKPPEAEDDKKEETDTGVPQSTTPDKAEESKSSTKEEISEIDKDIEELLKTSPGKKAMGVFKAILADTDGSDSSLPASKFESLVEEIGEGLHGDEFDKQLAIVDPNGSGLITSAAFVKWYHDLVNQEGDDDDSSQDSEIAEEKNKAEQAFDTVSQGSAKIPASDLNKLIEELGSVYCEEEHRRTIKKISSLESGEKVITKEAFVDWYIEWLFGDGDSEDEESFSDDESEVNTTKEGEVKAEGWGSMFKASEEGCWKCGVCMVSNKPSVTTCAACETPKPGEEGKASSGASTEKPATTSGSIGAGGFSFGGGLTSSSDSAVKSSTGIGAGGFSFGGFGGASTEKKSEGDINKTTLSGGITFGVPKKTEATATTGIGAGGFSFGGFGTKPAEESSEESKLSSDKEEDGIEDLLKTAPGKKAIGVFKAILADTDGSDSSLPASKFESLVEEIGEGLHGDEFDKQLAIVDPNGSGLITSAAFVKWYHDLVNQEGDDDDSSQDSEIAEEKNKAEQAFDTVSQGSAKIPASDLNKLIEELGSVYCEEEHRRTIKKISSLESGEKVITKEAFVDWYIEWLFGDGDSEDEESFSDDESEVNTTKEGEVKAEGWGSMFKASEEGCWKCGVCMVSNKPSVTTCAACETPKPGEEGKASSGASTEKPATTSGSIGAGGFSFGGGLTSSSDSAVKSSTGIGAGGFSFGGFGGASTEKKSEGDINKTTLSGGITFGVPKKIEATATTGIGAGGFSFGGFGTKPAEESSEESKLSGDKEEDGIEDLLKTAPGKKAMGVFKAILADTDGSDSSLPASKFESLVEEIGEGLHGDEFDKQLAIVDPNGSGLITSAAFVKWYHDLVNQEGDDDDSSQDSEIAEEKNKAEQAFDTVSQGSAKIPASDLNKLIEELGSVYCEEEHRRTIKKISSLESGEKVITKEAFVDWYIEWLFGDGDSEDEESFSDDESEVNTTKEGEVKAEGWGSMFKASEEGCWKCGVCMVSNKPSVTTCAACETPKPGEEGKASSGASTEKPATTSGSIGAGGFSFGGGLTSSSDSAVKSSTGIGAGGFSFGGFGGASTEKKSEGDSNKTTLSGGITFGVPKKTEATATTGIGAGGFSFGGFGTKPAEETADDDAANVEKSADSSSFPPIANVAPKPVTATTKKEEPKSSNAAFPPMSAAAPNPFFGAPAKKEESKPSKSAAAFPPMSAAAPKNPFSAKPSSSGAAFPPMSATAPKPFAAPAKKEESKPKATPSSSSATFPPMSAAAPNNPFSAKPSSSGAAFPPMSAAAPKPFFGAASRKEESKPSKSAAAFPPMSAAAPKNPFSAKPSSSGAAFPPMSATAPKPIFGAASKKEESKPSSAAFPPMSAAAPKPFGAFSTPASSSAGAPSPFASFSKKEDHKPTDKSSSTTAFPPMPKAAPSPFSAFSKKEESKPADKTTTSGSAFPPMSSAAPTNPFSTSAKPASSPFGAFSKKDDQKVSSSAAFPPMSAAAPKPFGASKTSEKVPSSTAFPPMSKAAPSPFSAFSKKDESKPSSTAFPPMSTAAPKPFGASFGKKEEFKAAAKPPSSAASFPPMSAAAPKPFGASFGKKEEFKAAAKPPSSAASFPPMSAAAPKPFGASFGKKEENKAAVKPSSGAAAFPPMSAAAPKPFGASFGKKEEFKAAVKPPSGAASFPPISAAAPKPVGATSSSSSTSSSTAGRSFSVSSKYEAEIWDQVNRFAKKTSNAKKLQREASSCIPSNLANNIDTMVNKYQENLSKSELHKDHNAAVNKRILQLFSVQDDLTRQKRESNLAIEEQTSEAASSTLARKEPLDAESEKMRRLIVSKCHKVQDNISTVEDRITLNKAIFNCSAGNRRNIRPSEYFNQSSKSQAIGREQKVKDANTALFKSLMGGYDRVRDLKPVVEELSKESTDLSNSQNQRELHQSGAKRTKTKNRLGSSPMPRSNLMSPLRSARRQKSALSRTSILEDSKSLRQLSSDLQLNPLPKTFYLRGQMRPLSTETKKIPDWRSKGRNELYSSTKPAQTRIVSQPVAASPAVAKNLFSSPLSTAKARSDWSKTSERDRGLLKVNIPQKLKTIDSADAAKAALAKFGTTPEKLAQGRDIISRDAEEAQTPLQVSSNKKSFTNKGITAPTNASFSAATSKTAPSLSLPKSKASAAFPPMPTSAPKPLSQAFKPSVAPAPTASAPASTPSQSTTTPDYKSVLTKFYSENSPGKVGEVDATLRKYEGKESEMFVALAKRYNKPNALNEVFESRVSNIDTKDYLKLATLYLQVFNAAKATPERIEAMLAKYKGKEEAMFASLSQKWYASNPLEMPKTAGPTAAPAQQPNSSETNAFGSKPVMTTSSAPAPSPFNTTTPAPAKTTDSAPAPSPFGVAAPAASPFGTTAPAPANSPFGTAASAPAPAAKSSEPDYHKILTEFYQKHNAEKVGEVAKTLEKYKGREQAMFAKLSQKYKIANPLDEGSSSAPAPSSSGTSFGFGGFGASMGGSTKSPFASTTTASSGASASAASSSTTAPASNTTAFGGGGGGNAFGASKSPFGSSAPGAHSPFGSAAPSPFGGGSAAGSAPAFGVSAAPSPSPFGNTPAPASSAFGSMQSPAPSAFGQPPAPTPSGPKFGGRNPRDILVSFYQTHNPTKMNDIDKVLTKYAGKEEQLFLNLAKKYNLDPSIFGVSASSQPSAPTFGSPAAATFGSSAPMGTGFGAPSTGGFGGSGGSGGFGGFAAAAAGGGGFGSLNQMGSSPAGFGGSAAPSFGSQPTPFGSARR